MPHSASLPCRQAGCGALVAGGGYCAAHRRIRDKDYNVKRKQDPLQREREAFYHTTAWRKLTAEMKRLEPLCRHCRARGLVTISTLTDHIRPISEAWELRFDPSNLQRLCDACHASKSALEGSRWPTRTKRA